MPIRRRGTLARRHPAAPRPRARPVPGAFERQVQAALDGLPPEIARLLETVAVVVEDLPTPGAGRRGRTIRTAGCTASTRARRSSSGARTRCPFPNVITLFRIPLQEDFPDPGRAVAGRSHGPSSTSWPITRASMTTGCTSWATTEPPTASRLGRRSRSTLPPEAMTHTTSPSRSGHGACEHRAQRRGTGRFQRAASCVPARSACPGR